MEQGRDDRAAVSQPFAEQVEGAVIDDATRHLVIHSNTSRENLRRAIQDAHWDVGPPEFLKD